VAAANRMTIEAVVGKLLLDEHATSGDMRLEHPRDRPRVHRRFHHSMPQARLAANSARRFGDVRTLPADRVRPPSRIATSQKSHGGPSQSPYSPPPPSTSTTLR
jgi:hypothetical protein